MTSPMGSRNVTKAVVSHVIVRACARCGHARELGKPCAGCGNPDAPVTHDLGVQSYHHRNPVKRAWWFLLGQHVAARRARQASRYVSDKS